MKLNLACLRLIAADRLPRAIIRKINLMTNRAIRFAAITDWTEGCERLWPLVLSTTTVARHQYVFHGHFLNAGEKLLVLNVRGKRRPVKLMARRPELSVTGDFFSHFLSHVANDLNRRGADVKAFDCVTRSK